MLVSRVPDKKYCCRTACPFLCGDVDDRHLLVAMVCGCDGVLVEECFITGVLVLLRRSGWYLAR